MAFKRVCDICGDDLDSNIFYRYKIAMYRYDVADGRFPKKDKFDICGYCKRKLVKVVTAMSEDDEVLEAIKKLKLEVGWF